jgi:CheY-like chemotaxis protein
MPPPSSSQQSTINSIRNAHIMLLYESNENRNNILIDYINEGLKNDCVCIYASVDIDNSKNMSLIDSLSSRIINYEENIQNENLKFIDCRPYYESALKGDLTLFEELKRKLENVLYKRISEGKKDKILFFADAACHLSETMNFSQSIDLEKWWQDVNLEWKRDNKDITIVCPHPNYVFKDLSLDYTKFQITDSHDMTIDIQDEHSLQYVYKLIKNNRQIIRILIAEPEPDIRYLYREYLDGLGLEVEIVENGSKCIEYLLDSKDKDKRKEEEFDMVILDSHLPDTNGVEVIKTIRKKMPYQRIVFTTTHPLSKINTVVSPFGIEKDDILVKPFNFTELLSTIKPSATTK